MKEVILIAGSLISPNFHVMIDTIFSADNVIIHVVAANNEKIDELPIIKNVKYYSYPNNRKKFFERLIKNKKNSSLTLFIHRIYGHLFAIYDNYFISSYEKAIKRQCLEIINSTEITAIFSVCLPFYTHRVAMFLQKKNPHIKWFSFWVDPYSNRESMQRNKLWHQGALAYEKNVFSASENIYALHDTFKGNKLISLYREKLIEFEIPYIKKRDFKNTRKQENKIVFFGTLYPKIREPEVVLEILSMVLDKVEDNVSFHFYTKQINCYEKLFNDYKLKTNNRIITHDHITRSEMYSIMNKSFMLINIGNSVYSQAPSKLGEYISFCKPIIHFYCIDNDTSLRYLTLYPDVCVLDVRNDLDESALVLSQFINSFHHCFNYDDLMKISLYKKSTPEYIASIVKL